MTKLLEPPVGRQVFSRAFTPAPDDIDANGHVNNVVYVRWIQDMATSHWTARQPTEDQAKWAWIVLRHEIDYRRALMPGETASARTWVAETPEGPRFDRFVRIDGPDGAMCAQARTVWCMIDQATGRPKRVTPDIVARFI
ncbi:MAG: thioesterase family protein [Pseudomonadota bacterium]|uniref:acyl-CoA thioesterase n=1 Tax=unclassified Phenylobacterium TaxID=2640670 RepID=UPI0006F40DAC|nr:MULTISPECIES: thioesterase family protein [unclassified Phenylobacterium]KRB46569.1 thioesterase [Phenylobacterium sp. Root700]MBT9471738.1 acyl-CoA thioesterase [Phenylobacterium sp.]